MPLARSKDMEQVNSENAPKAVGPYSQGIKAGNFLFCSGQIGIDPATGELANGIHGQTAQAISNLDSVLKAAGLGLAKVVRTDVFLTDMSHFAEVNEVYAEKFIYNPKPARQTVAVRALPKGALVEISAIAKL